MNHYLHNVPGRLRIKIPSIVDRPRKGNEVQRVLIDHDGIENVSVNTVTGSVVIRYDIDTTGTEDILNTLKTHQFIDPLKIRNDLRPIDQVSTKAGERVGKAIVGWVVGRALEANGFGFLAAFI